MNIYTCPKCGGIRVYLNYRTSEQIYHRKVYVTNAATCPDCNARLYVEEVFDMVPCGIKVKEG